MKSKVLYCLMLLLCLGNYSFSTEIDSIKFYHNQANKSSKNSNYLKAKNFTYQSINYKKRNNLSNLGDEYSLLASIYKRQGVYDTSLIYLDSAEHYFINKPQFKNEYAKVLLNKGRIFNKTHNFTSALNHLDKALIIFNTLKDTTNIANVYLNYGNTFKNIKKYSLAKQNYIKALHLFHLTNQPNLKANCYNNLGNLYSQLMQYDSSKYFFNKAIKYREKNTLRLSYAYHNLANLHIILKEFDSSLFYINKSLNIKYKINNESEIIGDYLVLGEIYYGMKDYKNAIYYLKKVIDKGHHLELLEKAQKLLAQSYFAKNNFKLASQHFNTYVQLNDSIVNRNTSPKLEQQLIEYELVKDSLERQQLKLKEDIAKIENKNLLINKKFSQSKLNFSIAIIIIILITTILLYFSFKKRLKLEKIHKTRLQIRNKVLKETLISKDEKEVLLKEIHHRVKNNLQIINSLIRLQSHYMTPQNYINKLGDTENRIRSMALVHEKLYKSKELSKLDAKEYINDLINNLISSYETTTPINIKYQIGDMHYSIDTLVPIGLIINEVVSNSIKYAFQGKEEGEIYIKFCSECKEGKTVLNIKDNGIGTDLEVDELSSDSLGMELIQSLAEQLNGELELNTDEGFNYFFTFPTLK